MIPLPVFFSYLINLAPMAMAAPAPPPFLVATLFLSTLLLWHAVQTTAAEQNNAFHFIEQLAGSHKGQNGRGLTELKKYLKKFGYLSPNHGENDVFDDALESAIKEYQLNFHMKSTGVIDEDTVKQMTRPRCGVADLQGTRQRQFSKSNLQTYKFNSGALISLGDKKTRTIFARAFQRWAEVTDFKFHEVPENSFADIEITIASEGSPFAGAGGVFGHVRGSESGEEWLQIHLDADEKWSANPGTAEIDLESAAVHEIGHLLGLDHNTKNREAIMNPCIDNGMVKRHLHEDDIRSVHALYGLTPN